MATASETQIEGDGPQGLPPTYSEVADDTTNQSIAAVQTQPTPGPAGNGKFFDDVPGKPSITFWIDGDPDEDDQHQPWFGQIIVKCDDVPLLMREGFQWTTENIIREEGFIENIRPQLAGLGKPNCPCTITRNWFLRDLQQPSRWTAHLQVHARDVETVSRIRLDSWTTDMVRLVTAAGLSDKIIYHFDAKKPLYAYNVIYDDMPLKGWWPWLKQDQQTKGV
ncbi:hypothetical protein F5X99DRAFT_239047 [Biscogniauxia marginata]|nr:hypothetical protein F5X99DRAFT_239047 [Biscogniauxia marginata]